MSNEAEKKAMEALAEVIDKNSAKTIVEATEESHQKMIELLVELLKEKQAKSATPDEGEASTSTNTSAPTTDDDIYGGRHSRKHKGKGKGKRVVTLKRRYSKKY